MKIKGILSILYKPGIRFAQGLKEDEIPLESRIIRAVANYCNKIYRWPQKKERDWTQLTWFFGHMDHFMLPDAKELIASWLHGN